MSVQTIKQSMTTGQAIERVREWGMLYTTDHTDCPSFLDVLATMDSAYKRGELSMRSCAAFEIVMESGRELFA